MDQKVATRACRSLVLPPCLGLAPDDDDRGGSAAELLGCEWPLLWVWRSEPGREGEEGEMGDDETTLKSAKRN